MAEGGIQPGAEGAGYSSREALAVLCWELQTELTAWEGRTRGLRTWLASLHHSQVLSLLHWTTALLYLVLSALLLLAAGFTDRDRVSGEWGWWLFGAIFLLACLVGNAILVIWNDNCRRSELVRLHKLALEKLTACKEAAWELASYQDLHIPLSPSSSHQWTMRDGHLVNLPQALLVSGDIIIMRPGQPAPGHCRQLQVDDTGSDLTELYHGDVFSAEIESCDDGGGGVQGRVPVKSCKFRLLETPVMENIRLCIGDKADRPPTIVENERHRIVSIWCERRLVPAITGIMLLINVLRFFYLKGPSDVWPELILVQLVHTLMPMMPIVFPAFWLLLNLYGQARIFAAFEVGKSFKVVIDDNGSFSSSSTISVQEARVDLTWRSVASWFLSLASGRANVLCRRTNVMQALGTCTTLCCGDKKGVLSWPNPTAEKLFFFSSDREGGKGDQRVKTELLEEEEEEEEDLFVNQTPNPVEVTKCPPVHPKSSSIEVLDVTHKAKSPFGHGLLFDDPTWKKHVDSLKPLGLNILLNTCEPSTVEWYTQFSDHIACAALENEETVAVVNRRCLCEVARQIGFSDDAPSVFSHEKTLGMYKQVPAEEAARERLHRAKSFIPHQIPMPNMVSVLVKDKRSGTGQLLTQGTADILLDVCTDYWNGRDICYLTENDKKKIIDFYHRNSMAAYCTSFSYRPLSQDIAPHLQDVYIELPQLSAYLPHSTTSRPSRASVINSFEMTGQTGLSLSMDSLMEPDSEEPVDSVNGCFQAQTAQIFIGMVAMQYQARQDFITLIDKLQNACIRFVHFSQENELRSRVFSEKMGLEAGWNCHISLLSESDLKLEEPTSGPGSLIHGDLSHRPSHHSSHHSTHGDLSQRPSLHSSRHSANALARPLDSGLAGRPILSTGDHAARSVSAPSLINVDEVQVKFAESISECDSQTDRRHSQAGSRGDSPQPEPGEATPLLGEMEGGQLQRDQREEQQQRRREGEEEEEQMLYEDEDEEEEEGADGDQSDSRHTSSYNTEKSEDSLTGVLDNRAKLPRGIENIRPHLENVDNVPLLVNLFTDCTHSTTCEMINIMQEYGEVVLFLGSSLNINNTQLFLQADICLGLEPLQPQVCVREPIIVEGVDSQASPTQLASMLVSPPCTLAFHRHDNISLVQLIAEARHHTQAVRNACYLMLCLALALSLLQLFGAALLLPPLLSTRHLLWLVVFIFPPLSVTLMGNPVDPRTMSLATPKNKDHISGEMLVRFLVQFLVRFVPSVLVCLLCHGLVLHSYCSLPQHNCTLYDLGGEVSLIDWHTTLGGCLALAQDLNCFILVLYFVFISVSFVHVNDHLWNKLPFTNKLWSAIAPIILVGQLLYSTIDIAVHSDAVGVLLPAIHPAAWCLGLLWPLVIVAVNELYKRQEIKLSVRLQKRARLDFGTKLGMNSPF